MKRAADKCASEAINSFDEMDKDGDGVMSILELKTMITHNPLLLQCKGMLFMSGTNSC